MTASVKPGEVARWSSGVPLKPGFLQAVLVEHTVRYRGAVPARVQVVAGFSWTDPDQLRAAAQTLLDAADGLAAHLANDGRQLNLMEATA